MVTQACLVRSSSLVANKKQGKSMRSNVQILYSRPAEQGDS